MVEVGNKDGESIVGDSSVGYDETLKQRREYITNTVKYLMNAFPAEVILDDFMSPVEDGNSNIISGEVWTILLPGNGGTWTAGGTTQKHGVMHLQTDNTAPGDGIGLSTIAESFAIESLPRILMFVETGAAITNTIMRLRLFDSGTPSYVELIYDSSVDGNWHITADAGGGPFTTDTTIVVAAATKYVIYMEFIDVNTAHLYFNGTGPYALDVTTMDETDEMALIMQIESVGANVNRDMFIGKILAIQNPDTGYWS